MKLSTLGEFSSRTSGVTWVYSKAKWWGDAGTWEEPVGVLRSRVLWVQITWRYCVGCNFCLSNYLHDGCKGLVGDEMKCTVSLWVFLLGLGDSMLPAAPPPVGWMPQTGATAATSQTHSQPSKTHVGVTFWRGLMERENSRLRDRQLNRSHLTNLCWVISLASQSAGENSTLSRGSWSQRKALNLIFFKFLLYICITIIYQTSH